MNYKLPSLLYAIRIILFVALLSSLLWMSSVISAVLFLVAVAFNLCDFVVVNKYGRGYIGVVNNIVFLILDRLTMLMPFFFACLYYSFAWWVFVILVVFEIAIHLYKYFSVSAASNKKLNNIVYYLYNIVLYAAAILFMIQKISLATYFVFAVTIVGAVCIVILSISYTSDDETLEKEEGLKEDKLIDEVSRVDEIVE